MKILRTTYAGELTKSEQHYFGGPYGFWEKLFLGGVGSNKLIYESGISDIDSLKRGVEGELVFINFEILPNGLIIRANCNQRKLVVGLKISDIQSIQLTAFKLSNHSNFHTDNSFKIEFEGVISITKQFSEKKAEFKVIGSEFNDLIKFFKAKQFNGKLNYSVINNKKN